MSTKSAVCEVVITRGGARAMLDHSVGEVMHPVVGPLVEAEELIRSLLAGSRPETRRVHPGPSGSVRRGPWGRNQRYPRVASIRGAPGSDQRRLSIVSFETSLTAFELALHDEHREAFGFEGRALEAGKHFWPMACTKRSVRAGGWSLATCT